ncbi:hypothetical protein BGZ70_007421 [Mortierella alpina]|uniref:Adhesin domain-containing protein n=1 Tax=Mortierella alpina TaxID=64518 RepID=A0A9P6J622_MORAP|nr:hypothetical protein BGZ70_007421 [Mortierella alpina]
MAKQQAVDDFGAPEMQASETQGNSGSPPAYSPPSNQADESQPLLRDHASRENSRRSSSAAVRRWFNSVRPTIKRASPLLIVLGVIALLIIFMIPRDAEVTTLNQTIDAALYRGLSFKLDRGISGDIVVSRSRNVSDTDIRVFVSMKASTSLMLESMAASVDLDPYTSVAKSRVFVNMTDPDLKKALARNCTWVDVRIIFPFTLDKGFKSLEIDSSRKGSVLVLLEDLELKEKLVIYAREGSIAVRDVRVGTEVKLEAERGDIEVHRLWADERVVAKASGSVVMDMGETSQYLDLEAISTKNAAVAILTKAFHGHVSLKSKRMPEVIARCCFYVTYTTNHTMEGFFTPNGYEPLFLPRVELSAKVLAKVVIARQN